MIAFRQLKDYLKHYSEDLRNKLLELCWTSDDVAQLAELLASVPTVAETINKMKSIDGVKELFSKMSPNNTENVKLLVDDINKEINKLDEKTIDVKEKEISLVDQPEEENEEDDDEDADEDGDSYRRRQERQRIQDRIARRR